jgi:hypothetical protein
MSYWSRMNIFKNQAGLSLVEVLLSVSIMSFVTLTIMGYFIQSVESSAEDSRRIVAIKLANMKVEQLREALKDDGLTFRKLSIMTPLFAGVRSMRIHENHFNSPVLSEDMQLLAPLELKTLLSPEKAVNGVNYHYILDLQADEQTEYADAFKGFTQGSSVNQPLDFLLKFRLTVYWGSEGAVAEPSKKMSTYLDSYLVFGEVVD